MVAPSQVPPFSPLKLHLSYPAQLDILKARNLEIGAMAAFRMAGRICRYGIRCATQDTSVRYRLHRLAQFV